jgi:Tfp pilus assembly protein PilO
MAATEKVDEMASSHTLARGRRVVMGALDHWPLIPRFGVAILAVFAGLGLRFAFLGSLVARVLETLEHL